MITKLFAKSDNAGCYHGNHVMEALYKICLSKSLTLVRYDYNEPCKGKDQCDRESAGAKSVINSFVNSGSDLVSANDLHDALHYGKGIRNTKACILEVNLEQSTLQGLPIKGISTFHSVQFFKKHMKLQRYYNIGPGVVVNYSDQSKFVPSYVQVKEFNHTQSEVVHEPCTQQKKRLDHQLCTLIFCENPLCTDVFETLAEYERHLLSEKHTITNQDSTMDKVRASYVTKMKVASQKHSYSTSTESEIATVTLSESLSTCPLMKEIAEQGWALPHRSNFKYSYEQKVLLYDIFMEGEKTNKKMSPQDAELLIRKDLKPNQYVSKTQIRYLFGTFATQLKKGTLKRPTRKSTEEANNQEEVEPEVEAREKEKDDNYHIDLAAEVQQVMSEISDWEVGNYVAVRVDHLWYPGKITKLQDDGRFEVTRMLYVDEFAQTNKFRENGRTASNYDKKDLLLAINEPLKVTTGKRLLHYKLAENDFNLASNLLKVVLS